MPLVGIKSQSPTAVKHCRHTPNGAGQVLHAAGDGQKHLEHESGERPRRPRKEISPSRFSRFFQSFSFQMLLFSGSNFKTSPGAASTKFAC
jgi:hypothetical protein